MCQASSTGVARGGQEGWQVGTKKCDPLPIAFLEVARGRGQEGELFAVPS